MITGIHSVTCKCGNEMTFIHDIFDGSLYKCDCGIHCGMEVRIELDTD